MKRGEMVAWIGLIVLICTLGYGIVSILNSINPSNRTFRQQGHENDEVLCLLYALCE
jgi:hypothetical protein